MITPRDIKICANKRDAYVYSVAFLDKNDPTSEAALCTLSEIIGPKTAAILKNIFPTLSTIRDAASYINSNFSTCDYVGIYVSTTLSTTGDLNIRWKPDCAKTSQSEEVVMQRVRYEFGLNVFNITIPNFRTLKDTATRNADHLLIGASHACLMIGKLLQDVLSNEDGIKAQQDYCASLKPNGELIFHDTEAEICREHENWLALKSSENDRLLGQMKHMIIDRKLTDQQVQEQLKRNGIDSNAHNIAHVRSKFNAIQSYNEAWWRRRDEIPLPASRYLKRQSDPEKRLVKINGRTPRTSPLINRDVEGRHVAPKGQLSALMVKKINMQDIDWHFTAGDFVEFVKRGDRRRIVRALERMKQSETIFSDAKGIYTQHERYWNKETCIGALMRDRGEVYCIAPWEAARREGIGVEEQDYEFITNGNTRSITIGGKKVFFKREAYEGLCEATLDMSLADKQVFLSIIALSESNIPRRTETIDRIRLQHPQLYKLANKISNTLIL